MPQPKKSTTLLNDELVFKPIRDLQTPNVDRRNSWSISSHLPAQPSPLPSPQPSTTDSLPAKHHPPTPSPITPSKPTTAITIPSSHLPPTPSPTPTRNLKRSYSSLIEIRLPTPTPTNKNDTTSPPHRPKNQPPTTSPSPRPTKRQCKRQPPTHPLFPPFNPLTPSFSIRYRHPPPPSHPPISAVELKRAAESILRQVDWDIVAEDVASNRARGVFRKVVREVLQGGVDALGGK